MTTFGWVLHKLEGEILKERCSYMDMMDWVKILWPAKHMHFVHITMPCTPPTTSKYV
jgi:hypothetical protein